jgi:hypothetical protein
VLTEIERLVPITIEAFVVAVQPFVAPITLYIVVDAGDAVKEELITLDPGKGSHVYVVAPAAVSVAVWPAQIVILAALRVGVCVTKIEVVAVEEQFPEVPVTV